MASPGAVLNNTVVTAMPLEAANQRLMSALTGSGGGYFDGTVVMMAGPQMITVTRKYVPTWAFVVAGVGFFCMLLGLLALLYRQTETLTIQFQPVPEGTQIAINGLSSQQVVSQINSVIYSL